MGFNIGKLGDFNPIYGYRLIKNLKNLFGFPYMLLASSMFFTQNGILGSLAYGIQFPYYLQAGVDLFATSEMSIISNSPTNLKSFIGLLTDLFPIGGRRKFYYVFTYVSLGIIATLLLAIIPLETVKQDPIIAAILFFFLNWASHSSDVLFESKNIELMQKNPQIKSDLLSYCWVIDSLGRLIPNFLIGYVTEYWNVQGNFIIFVPFFFLPIIFLLMGGLIEDKIDRSKKKIGLDYEVLTSQWKLVLLSFFQLCVSIGSMIFTYFFDETVQLIYGIATGAIIVGTSYIFLDIRTANWYCFLVLNATFYIEIQEAFYFYYLDENCVENGPILNFVVINSWGSTINTIIQFVGILCFQVLFYDWKFRSAFCLIILIRIGSVIFDLMIIYKWTDAIGLPNELIYLFGNSVVGMMAFIIMIYLNSYMNAKLCPKYFEATMYSLLTASGYVGVTAARFIGIYLMNAFNIESRHDPENDIYCNYDSIGILAIIGNLLLPLLSIPCIYLLIPNIRLNEIIIKDQISNSQIVENKKIEISLD